MGAIGIHDSVKDKVDEEIRDLPMNKKQLCTKLHQLWLNGDIELE